MRRRVGRMLVAVATLTVVCACAYRVGQYGQRPFVNLSDAPLFADGFDRLVAIRVSVHDATGSLLGHRPLLVFHDPGWASEPGQPTWLLGGFDGAARMAECADKSTAVDVVVAVQARAQYIEIETLSLFLGTGANSQPLDIPPLGPLLLEPGASANRLDIPLQGSFVLEPQRINYLGRLHVTIHALPGRPVRNKGTSRTTELGREVGEQETTYAGGSYEVEFSSTDAAMQEDVDEIQRAHARTLAGSSLAPQRIEPVIQPALRAAPQ